MKYTIAALLAVIALLMTFAHADVWVRGHFKGDGSYVQGHFRSSINSTPYDNWSTKGNTNPYTGKKGTITPTCRTYKSLC